MIQTINKSMLKEMEKASDETVLSVYVPLKKGMVGHKFNKAQLHNVKSELKKTISRKQHEQVSKEIESVLEEIDQKNDSPGVAFFSEAGDVKTYSLPFAPEKTTTVGKSYDVEQIQEYYSHNKPYYVLAISKKGSTLYQGDMEGLHLVDAPGLGKDVDTTLRIDEPGADSLQNHPSAPGSNKAAGFHGHGGYKDVKKILFDSYLRVVDKIVVDTIKDKTMPLVLVSVDYEQSAYKSISNYPSIFTKTVSTNPDDLSTAELHQKTLPLIDAAGDA